MNKPVAIIGMGCIFPQAPELRAFWRNIRTGIDAIREIPESHWKPEDYFAKDATAPDRTYCRRGGFIAPYPFDPLEYGIPPTALEATDTSQLLGLVVARAALDDAGYGANAKKKFDKEKVSVILGVTGTLELVIPLGARLGHPHWRKALKEAGVPDEQAAEVCERIAASYVPWQENSFPGLLGNVVAGRIANRLDLGGTNCVVDAACASSLSATHLAAMELSSGRADMVVTGGVDTFNDIFMYVCFSKTPALSPTGDAKPFDESADGTILGEGLGMVVLKRLEDAERDGDRIYAVIRGVGTSSDGKNKSIYAPVAEGQAKALRAAYKDAGISPATVELVEAHGTGTKVGDATEAEALRTVYREAKADGTWCALGTVKSQIGHTKAAAGAAGLIKAALALHHKVLPPTLKVTKPNPKLGLGPENPFYLSTETRPWAKNDAHPRRAGVSSFGFGGSNFHLVLEEWKPEKPEVAWDGSVEIVAVSGRTTEELTTKLATVEKGPLERAAARSRKSFDPGDPRRLVLAIDNTDANALPKLMTAVRARLAKDSDKSWELPEGAFFGTGTPGKLAVLFPGQGSQYVNMGRDLAVTFPEAHAVLVDADEATLPDGARVSERTFPRPVFSDADRKTQLEKLTRTDVTQPSLAFADLAAWRVLERFGVKADATCGHSFGELVALCAAGRIDAATLHELARLRGKLMAEGDGGRGGMAAVMASVDAVTKLIGDEKLDLVIANKNAPAQVVISGRKEEVARAVLACKARKLSAKELPVSAAFHSPLVAKAAEPFRAALERVAFAAGASPVLANATASPYPADVAAARDLLGSQLVRPVDFTGMVERLYADGVRTFVEAGPKNVLAGLVKSTLGERAHVMASVDSSAGKRSGILDLARVLAQLAAAGHAVALSSWERPVLDTPETKPRMTVPLSGANHRSSKVEVKARPRPVAPVAPVALAPAPMNGSGNGANGNGHAHGNGNGNGYGGAQVTQPRTTTSTPTPVAATTVAPTVAPATVAPATVAPANAGLVREALVATQESVRAVQALQEQTAALHRRFLEGQQSAHQTFQSLLEGQQRLVERALGLAPAVTTVTGYVAPARVTPPAPTVTPAPIAYTAPVTVSVPVPVTVSAPATGSVTAPAPVTVPATATATATATAVARLEKVLLEVVSEKTGYPLETLQLDMDLEADLGIDSIKRVEILSGVQERAPDAPAVEPEHLGGLRTLRKIVDFIGSRMGGAKTTSAPAPAKVALAPAAPPSPALPPLRGEREVRGDGFDASRLEKILLQVVSEKTGYPLETLQLDMDLESDLGIDSIKRVEILSGVQERAPDAPAVEPEHLGGLRTLRKIVDFIASRAGSARPVAARTAAPVAVAAPIAAPSSAAKGGFDASRLEKILLQVVSEKTGYPLETLQLDMDLESDLGIDSIKRVEILSGVQERAPEAPAVEPEHLGGLRTLRKIVDFIASRAAPSAPPPSPALPPLRGEREKAAGVSLERRVLTVRELANASDATLTIAPGHELWITDDGSPLANALAAALGGQGINARTVHVDTRIDNSRAPVAGLVILAPAPTTAASETWGPDSEGLLDRSFKLVKSLAGDLRAAAKKGGAVLATVSRLDGAFGLRGHAWAKADPVTGGLAGLSKTAAQEWPEVRSRALDVDATWTDAKAIAAALARELAQAGPIEVGLSAGGRATVEATLAPWPTSLELLPLAKDDVVLVSGGARGVTAETALALAQASGAHVVLLGRSALESEPAGLAAATDEAALKRALVQQAQQRGEAPNPRAIGEQVKKILANREVRANLERIRAHAKVDYRAVDVRDEKAVAKVVEEIRASLGPIKAIVHGAGVLEDRRIEEKTAEQFANVVETKVRGLRALLVATAGDELAALILFSSISGRLGRRGQVDYAMANEVLNKVAHREAARRPGCRVVSIGWGPWEGGMVTPGLKREFEKEGVPLIPLEAGGRALVQELTATGTEILVGGPAPATPPSPTVGGGSAGAPRTNNVGMNVVLERELDVARHPFLRSHVLGGRPVMPLAMTMEWLAHAALHGNPGLIFHGFSDLRVLRALAVEAGAAPLVRAYAAPAQKKGAAFEVPVELRSRSANGSSEVVHARATAVLVAALPLAPTFENPNELTTRAYPLGVDGAYEKVLFHGPELRGIEEVHGLTSRGALATFRAAPSPEKWIQDPVRTAWIADPLALDSAFQLAILWCREEKGAASLPAHVGTYRQFKAFPKDGVTCALVVTKQTAHGVTGELTFCARDGSVVARIEGYECTVDPALAAAFGRAGARSS